MKRFFYCVIIAIITMISWMPSAYASSNPSVFLDGKQLYFDVPAQIIDGRTMVPMRTIFEELGAVVTWDSVTQTVSASKNAVSLSMKVGSNIYNINGNNKVSDVTVKIINGRTLVPLRIVAESVNCMVDYNANANSVIIQSQIIDDSSMDEENESEIVFDTEN